MIVSAHNNQQLFSDHYLDEILPQQHDWNALASEAELIMAEIGALLAKYKPSDKEAQLEHDFIRPVLRVLGHTFEVQASLATPDGTKQPDYIFYSDEETLFRRLMAVSSILNTTHFLKGMRLVTHGCKGQLIC